MQPLAMCCSALHVHCLAPGIGTWTATQALHMQNHNRLASFWLSEGLHVQDHPKFQSVADEAPLLYSREQQMGAEKKPHPMKLGEAVQKGIIGSQTLAYFIGRTYLFMKKIGMDPERLRFRQHLQNEMAHYASDCWDAEAESSYGWIECAGLSDRSAYDLKVQHWTL